MGMSCFGSVVIQSAAPTLLWASSVRRLRKEKRRKSKKARPLPCEHVHRLVVPAAGRRESGGSLSAVVPMPGGLRPLAVTAQGSTVSRGREEFQGRQKGKRGQLPLSGSHTSTYVRGNRT